MEGTIDVSGFMEAYRRSQDELKEFKHSQWKIRITNALWAYRVCEDKQAVVELYKQEFSWLNEHRIFGVLTGDTIKCSMYI